MCKPLWLYTGSEVWLTNSMKCRTGGDDAGDEGRSPAGNDFRPTRLASEAMNERRGINPNLFQSRPALCLVALRRTGPHKEEPNAPYRSSVKARYEKGAQALGGNQQKTRPTSGGPEEKTEGQLSRFSHRGLRLFNVCKVRMIALNLATARAFENGSNRCRDRGKKPVGFQQWQFNTNG